jgi:hypothetical protein
LKEIPQAAAGGRRREGSQTLGAGLLPIRATIGRRFLKRGSGEKGQLQPEMLKGAEASARSFLSVGYGRRKPRIGRRRNLRPKRRGGVEEPERMLSVERSIGDGNLTEDPKVHGRTEGRKGRRQAIRLLGEILKDSEARTNHEGGANGLGNEGHSVSGHAETS